MLGCDRTNVNTGNKGGVIILIELKPQWPLQWLICLLHANELPLCHLFEELDGPTSGPRCYSGSIGKFLETCEILKVVDFQPINHNVEMPEVDRKVLSTDQLYLFDIWQALLSGTCSINLEKCSPGKLAHSTWLITANRIFRLCFYQQPLIKFGNYSNIHYTCLCPYVAHHQEGVFYP